MDADTLIRREADAHHNLIRLVERYPDSQTTYKMVLEQLNLCLLYTSPSPRDS